MPTFSQPAKRSHPVRKRLLPIISKVAFAIFLIIAFVCIYRAYVIYKPCKHAIQAINPAQRIIIGDRASSTILNRFRTALRFATVSFSNVKQNTHELTAYVSYIRSEFAYIESQSFVTCHVFGNHSLLYEIRGRNESLRPYMLAAHSDVVPANGVEENWTHDPFSADLDAQGEHVYARGAMDDKASMISQLEAISAFIAKHGQPHRTLFLAYGHDEEVQGLYGAKQMAGFLSNRAGEFEFVIDEGSVVLEDAFGQLDQPVACIGIAEKGYLSLKFFVNVTGGHSSMPNKDESALFILADAISKLKNNQVPSRLEHGPEKHLFDELCVYLDAARRIALANLWLFKPVIQYIFSKNPTTDSLQRTTTAVTMFNGGLKENVMPQYAEFVVNHRIHSSQTCVEIIDHDVRAIDDERVKFEVIGCVEPTHVSPINNKAYSLIKHTIMQIFPESLPIPSVTPGMTDSRYYSHLTKNIYKFLPMKIKNSELKRYHGVDERISVANYENMINFYLQLITNADNIHMMTPVPEHAEL